MQTTLRYIEAGVRKIFRCCNVYRPLDGNQIEEICLNLKYFQPTVLMDKNKSENNDVFEFVECSVHKTVIQFSSTLDILEGIINKSYTPSLCGCLNEGWDIFKYYGHQSICSVTVFINVKRLMAICLLAERDVSSKRVRMTTAGRFCKQSAHHSLIISLNEENVISLRQTVEMSVLPVKCMHIADSLLCLPAQKGNVNNLDKPGK